MRQPNEKYGGSLLVHNVDLIARLNLKTDKLGIYNSTLGVFILLDWMQFKLNKLRTARKSALPIRRAGKFWLTIEGVSKKDENIVSQHRKIRERDPLVFLKAPGFYEELSGCPFVRREYFGEPWRRVSQRVKNFSLFVTEKN